MRSIAIDGPSGAGKSTISRRLARDLGFLYVDTGAIYRVVGLFALENPEVPLPEGLDKINVGLTYSDGVQHMSLNGRDVTSEIRAHKVSKAASDASAIPEVRRYLLDRQRGLARDHDVIMDGRDIGTVVLPDADVKIFLTAKPEDRARRRYEELRSRGQDVEYETVLADIRQRDFNDSNREAAPLIPAHDAITVDTTGNTWEKSVGVLRKIIVGRLGLE
ncbi:MAG: (d)CMP kinase [Oscillospiraceae bacterium]|jgi:cytidylate kinase|nr:(d)CMP kinase [Oscillospiraceae bacterium]